MTTATVGAASRSLVPVAGDWAAAGVSNSVFRRWQETLLNLNRLGDVWQTRGLSIFAFDACSLGPRRSMFVVCPPPMGHGRSGAVLNTPLLFFLISRIRMRGNPRHGYGEDEDRMPTCSEET